MSHCFFQFNFRHHNINSAHVSQIILQSSNHNFIFLIAYLLFPSQFVPLYSHIHVSFLLSHSCCLHHNCFVSFLTHFITFHTVGHFLFIHILFYWHIFAKLISVLVHSSMPFTFLFFSFSVTYMLVPQHTCTFHICHFCFSAHFFSTFHFSHISWCHNTLALFTLVISVFHHISFSHFSLSHIS